MSTASRWLLPLACLAVGCQAPAAPMGGIEPVAGPAAGAAKPPATGANPVASPNPQARPSGAAEASPAEAARAAAGFGAAAPHPVGRPAAVSASPKAGGASEATGGAPSPQPVQVAPPSSVVGVQGPSLPLVVGLQAQASTTELLARPEMAGFRLVGDLRLGDRRIVKLSPPAGLSSLVAAQRVRAQAGVRYAGPEGWRRPSADFAFQRPDPLLPKQWAHQAAFGDTHPAWTLVGTPAQAKVIVAVIDTGVDVDHPEFAARYELPHDARTGVGDRNQATDEVGHGTHVAGIALAAGNNGDGVAGVAWGARLLAIKALGLDGGSDFDVLTALSYAIQYRPEPDTGARVRVINMSLGGPDGEVQQSYVDAVAAARQAGIVVVAASGNEALDMVAAPASTPGAIAVGATHHRLAWEAVAPFSNRGAELSLVAPGANVLSTLPRNMLEAGVPYGFKDGTSMAAPYVAGAVALMAARYDPNHQRLDATWVDSVRRRLVAACDDLGPPGVDPASGAGRLNLRRALTPVTLEDSVPN